jgi:dipeptidyl aminopeptidase/acylaminoacyl peptidase
MKYLALFILIFFAFKITNAQILKEPKYIMEGSEPSFSHDGRYVACEHNRKIWIIDLKTNTKRQVSNMSWDFKPRWSPKDDKIVFQSYGNSIDFEKRQRFSIWIINIDGSNPHKLIEEMTYGDQSPYWSPDGKKIAWTHGKQLWIIDSDGKNAKPLTKDPAIEWEHIVDWSMDSKSILYIRRDSYLGSADDQVCLVDTNSLNQKRIGLLKRIGHAKFAPDKLSLYFTTYDNFISKYYIATQHILKNLISIKNKNETRYFDFSPDFNSLVYDNSAPEPSVYIIKIK